MNAGVIAAIGTAWGLGLLAVSALWPRTRAWRADAALMLPLGLGVGLGLTSVTFFLASMLTPRPALMAAGLDLLGALGLAWLAWRRRGAARDDAERTWHGWEWLLATVGVQASVVAAVVAQRAWAAEPWGAWDGWAIWNMRARFMVRGGAEWTDVLRHTEIGWSHLDYPLLVPASVARAWAWARAESAAATGLVSVLFGAATVALLIAAAARLRNPTVAWLSGLTLLGTPFFVTFTANEHADIPLGFFVLAAVALGALSGRTPASRGLPALAGVAAGLAAWTKNEGLLIAAVTAFVVIAAAWRHGEWRSARMFLAGLGVALAPVIFFKLAFAPGNDLVSSTLGSRLAQLVAPARHAEIWAALWRDVTGFGEWRVVPFAAMALALATPGARQLLGRERGVAWVLGLTLAGYYAVYLITPWELAGHLASSLVRLLLQLWPAALLLWCLLAAPAEAAPEVKGDAGAGAGRPAYLSRTARVMFWLLNVGVAAALVWHFDRQLAPTEVAAARMSGGVLSVTAESGWFGPETHGRDTWRWSGGRGALRLHVDTSSTTTRGSLHFALRALGARTVRVTLGDRVVWEGRVEERSVRVRLENLPLSNGTVTLVFSSPEPAVPEATTPGARTLAFALYNLRVE